MVSMQRIAHSKLITAILPKGIALELIEKLKVEKGLTTANFSYARGMGRLTPAKFRGIGEQSEKEILSVVVEAERGDEVFEYLFHAANIDRPHGGIIYMQKLMMSTEFRLPTTVEEEA